MAAMQHEISVHDNVLYAMAVDFESQTLVLHTFYPPQREYTDVIFEEVLVEFFEDAGFRDGNILFDIEQVSLNIFIRDMDAVLAARKNYRWPPLEYDGLADLEAKLINAGVNAFQISASLGMSGWILAKSCSRLRRPDRAQLIVTK